MSEEQQHGFFFEDWVKKTFFHIHYTSEWDIPRKLNPHPENGPISIKTAKWGGGIGFGDAVRQYEINETFTLIVGFWQQSGKYKKIVKVVEAVVAQDMWRKLWEPLQIHDLQRLDRIIKNRDLDPVQVRKSSQRLLAQSPFTDSIITLNPKIDSKQQRRLQCSLSRGHFFQYIAPTVSPDPEKHPKLWGRPVSLRLPGGPRFSAG